MNCLGCGRFMQLWPAIELEEDVGKAALWWMCKNDQYCLQYDHPIPAPEYDWLWWGISNVELNELHEEEPETALCFEDMKWQYDNRPIQRVKTWSGTL